MSGSDVTAGLDTMIGCFCVVILLLLVGAFALGAWIF